MFNRARLKLTLLLVAILAILYTLTTSSVYIVMNRMTMATVDSQLSLISEHMVPRILFFWGRWDTADNGSPSLPGHQTNSGTALLIRDVNGQILINTAPTLTSTFPFTLSTLNDTVHFDTVHDTKQHEWLRIITAPLSTMNGTRVGYVQLALSINGAVALLDRLQAVMIVVGLIGIVIAFVGGLFASGRAMRPIARSWNEQRRFVADASHEFRTPLSVISSSLDILLVRAEQSIFDNMEWISNAKTETRRMTRLAEDLLTLARTDDVNTQVARVPVDLSAIAKVAVENLELIAETKEISIALHAKEGSRVEGDPDRLHQLCVILLDNAIKYTPVGGTIDVSVTPHGRFLRLEVCDTGMGISDADLDHIFDRFYRSDQARNRENSGVGLGLSIAKWIVTMHHGRIAVASQLGAGSTFTVTLRMLH